MTAKKKKSAKKTGKKISRRTYIIIFSLLAAIVVFVGVSLLYIIYSSNLKITNRQKTYIYIHTNSEYEDVCNSLENYLENKNFFRWVSGWMKYQKIKPGRYTISDGMNNYELISLLKSGRQEPVKVIVGSYNTPFQMAGKISKFLDTDSISILHSLYKKEFFPVLKNDSSIFSFIFPDTYFLYWNTSADSVVSRLVHESEKYYKEKIHIADSNHLTEQQLVTIASIVAKETAKNDEMPRIAGVYLNRIRIGMPLQADPTIKYAIQDFSLRRILSKHLEINSQYNTYKVKGLPPTPICNPPKVALEAVARAEKHNYLYFCAKEDFSGYSNFATNVAEHLHNAARYQQALNKRKIYK